MDYLYRRIATEITLKKDKKMGRGKKLYHYTLKKPLTAPTKKKQAIPLKGKVGLTMLHKQLKQTGNLFR